MLTVDWDKCQSFDIPAHSVSAVLWADECKPTTPYTLANANPVLKTRKGCSAFPGPRGRWVHMDTSPFISAYP